MDYIHDRYSFPPPPQPNQQPIFYHPGPYHHYVQQPAHQVEDLYMPYGHPDYPDYLHHGPFADEYEDAGEVATRPRLTKEQVGVLEAQFQANHKPNSMVKRQLALQTNLSLPRVAVSRSSKT
jgi:Homeodomain